MKSKCILAVLVCVLGTAVYAGNVLATPGSGLTTTILAKSLFNEIDVNALDKLRYYRLVMPLNPEKPPLSPHPLTW